MNVYQISGLCIRCSTVLPGVVPSDGANPDVEIAAGDVPAEIADVCGTGPNWNRSERQFLLDIPPIGRFLLEDGRRITFALRPGVSDWDLAPFLSGTVFGILLHQRGQVVLHASAVSLGDGRAALFCGASGVGKSTLAAAFVERGYPMVADDQCAVVLDGANVPVLYPDGRYLKLWSRSIDALALDRDAAVPMRGGFEKFYVEPGRNSIAPHRIAAIYVLAEAKPPAVSGITRLNVVDGTNVVLANAYRPQLVRRMNQRGEYFRVGAALAGSAGLYTLTRPLRFSAMAETIVTLEQHWAEIGMNTAAAFAG